MPQIPLPQVPMQTAPTPLPTPGEDTQVFQDQRAPQIQDAGRSLMVAGGAVSQLAAGLQDKYNRAVASQKDVDLAESIRVTLTDPKTGFLNLRGEEAINARSEAIDQIQQAHRDISGGIQNADQRYAYGEAAQQRMGRALQMIDTHTAQQTVQMQDDEDLARMGSLTRDFVDYWSKNAGANTASAAYGEALVEQAKATAAHRGWAPDSQQTKNLVLAATSQANAAVIEKLVREEKPDQAAAVLQRGIASKAIDPLRQGQLEDLVRRAGDEDQGSRLALQLMAQKPVAYGPEQAPGRSWADTFQQGERDRIVQGQEARATLDQQFMDGKITDQVRKHALGEIGHIERQHEQDLLNTARSVRTSAEQWLIQNPNAAVDELPTSLLQQVDAYGVHDDLNQFSESGRRYSTNTETRAMLRAQPWSWWRDQDPARFEKEYRGSLDNHDMQFFQATMAKAQGRATPDAEKVAMQNLAIEVSAENLGMTVHGTSTAAQKAQFDRYKLAALQVKQATPETPIEDILKEMERLNLSSGDNTTNLFRMSDQEKQKAMILSPSGREIPLADIVDEHGNEAVLSTMDAIRAKNIERAQKGLPQIPETLQQVAAAWEDRVTAAASVREKALADEMAQYGMKKVARGNEWLGFGLNYVSATDAQKLTGLTQQELEERVLPKDTGYGYQGMVIGFTPAAVARVRGQLQARKQGR